MRQLFFWLESLFYRHKIVYPSLKWMTSLMEIWLNLKKNLKLFAPYLFMNHTKLHMTIKNKKSSQLTKIVPKICNQVQRYKEILNFGQFIDDR